jgi:2-C-methyl-D-erythritol 4-phosphate cytidylyltransferase/2-C-methyl-D-erythritol 2,4-cyclodiphosphate synthase
MPTSMTPAYNRSMSVAVIIVAAGRGERVGASVPKQLLDLGGRTLLQRSVAAFDGHARIGEIVVVLPAELAGEGMSLVGPTEHPCRFVSGGARRQDSVARGFAALSDAVEIVLVHDAARPFVDAGVIDRVLAATDERGAAVPVVAARDTVKRVDEARGEVAATIPRGEIGLAQTPQGFRRAVLADAIALGARGVQATDEAMLAEQAGHPVVVVTGDERNVKITTPGDLAAARARLSAGPRVGIGYDLHRLVEGRPLVLAGLIVPFHRGPSGHSDGDVLCHALIDALLGAAGAGDIGQLFPDSEDRWKDAPGLDLLARAVETVRARGWAVASVDVTIVLERPRLGPHIAELRARLAPVLGLAGDLVSVKAKTNEGVDAVGRGEAIAAHAVAVLAPGDRP